jgi:hypothetical protein
MTSVGIPIDASGVIWNVCAIWPGRDDTQGVGWEGVHGERSPSVFNALSALDVQTRLRRRTAAPPIVCDSLSH